MNGLSVSLAAIFVLALSFFPFSINAQDAEIETLFSGDGNMRISGSYGAVVMTGSQLDDGFGWLLGARGGIIFNNSFLIGGAAYGLIPTKQVKNCPMPEHNGYKHYLTGGYGGLYFEYIHSSNRLVHFTANMLTGLGGITYARAWGSSKVELDEHYSVTRDNHQGAFIFVLEPGIAMDLNVTKAFRMSLGVNYRYCPNFKLNDVVANTKGHL